MCSGIAVGGGLDLGGKGSVRLSGSIRNHLSLAGRCL